MKRLAATPSPTSAAGSALDADFELSHSVLVLCLDGVLRTVDVGHHVTCGQLRAFLVERHRDFAGAGAVAPSASFNDASKTGSPAGPGSLGRAGGEFEPTVTVLTVAMVSRRPAGQGSSAGAGSTSAATAPEFGTRRDAPDAEAAEGEAESGPNRSDSDFAPHVIDLGVVHDGDRVVSAIERAAGSAGTSHLCMALRRPGEVSAGHGRRGESAAKTRLFFASQDTADHALESVERHGVGFGVLEKRCEDKAAYRPRWFVLTRDQLWYCKLRPTKRGMTCLPLPPRTTCHLVGESSFQLFTGRRAYVLRAHSRQEMLQWVECIELRKATVTDADLLGIVQRELHNAEASRARERRGDAFLATTFRGAWKHQALRAAFVEFLVPLRLVDLLPVWLQIASFLRDAGHTAANAAPSEDEVADEEGKIEGGGGGEEAGAPYDGSQASDVTPSTGLQTPDASTTLLGSGDAPRRPWSGRLSGLSSASLEGDALTPPSAVFGIVNRPLSTGGASSAARAHRVTHLVDALRRQGVAPRDDDAAVGASNGSPPARRATGGTQRTTTVDNPIMALLDLTEDEVMEEATESPAQRAAGMGANDGGDSDAAGEEEETGRAQEGTRREPATAAPAVAARNPAQAMGASPPPTRSDDAATRRPPRSLLSEAELRARASELCTRARRLPIKFLRVALQDAFALTGRPAARGDALVEEWRSALDHAEENILWSSTSTFHTLFHVTSRVLRTLFAFAVCGDSALAETAGAEAGADVPNGPVAAEELSPAEPAPGPDPYHSVCDGWGTSPAGIVSPPPRPRRRRVSTARSPSSPGGPLPLSRLRARTRASSAAASGHGIRDRDDPRTRRMGVPPSPCFDEGVCRALVASAAPRVRSEGWLDVDGADVEVDVRPEASVATAARQFEIWSRDGGALALAPAGDAEQRLAARRTNRASGRPFALVGGHGTRGGARGTAGAASPQWEPLLACCPMLSAPTREQLHPRARPAREWRIVDDMLGDRAGKESHHVRSSRASVWRRRAAPVVPRVSGVDAGGQEAGDRIATPPRVGRGGRRRLDRQQTAIPARCRTSGAEQQNARTMTLQSLRAPAARETSPARMPPRLALSSAQAAELEKRSHKGAGLSPLVAGGTQSAVGPGAAPLFAPLPGPAEDGAGHGAASHPQPLRLGSLSDAGEGTTSPKLGASSPDRASSARGVLGVLKRSRASRRDLPAKDATTRSSTDENGDGAGNGAPSGPPMPRVRQVSAASEEEVPLPPWVQATLGRVHPGSTVLMHGWVLCRALVAASLVFAGEDTSVMGSIMFTARGGRSTVAARAGTPGGAPPGRTSSRVGKWLVNGVSGRGNNKHGKEGGHAASETDSLSSLSSTSSTDDERERAGARASATGLATLQEEGQGAEAPGGESRVLRLPWGRGRVGKRGAADAANGNGGSGRDSSASSALVASEQWKYVYGAVLAEGILFLGEAPHSQPAVPWHAGEASRHVSLDVGALAEVSQAKESGNPDDAIELVTIDGLVWALMPHGRSNAHSVWLRRLRSAQRAHRRRRISVLSGPQLPAALIPLGDAGAEMDVASPLRRLNPHAQDAGRRRPALSADNEVLLQGYLYKRGKLNTAWKKRLGVLRRCGKVRAAAAFPWLAGPQGNAWADSPVLAPRSCSTIVRRTTRTRGPANAATWT